MLVKVFSLVAVVAIASCAQQSEPMTVDLFKLRSTDLAERDAAMVRGDQNFVLYGQVDAKARELKLGQYYILQRRDTDRIGTFRFSYQQVKTGSKVLVKSQTMEIGQKRAEFRVIGEDFLTNGKVLAWKADLLEDGKVVASEQSYMWE